LTVHIKAIITLDEVKDDIARVIAVLPMRRDPAWIEKKLKRRS
jgi:hypothetical protein